MTASSSSRFGRRRVCYVNFAGHLLNAYNPNVLHPGQGYEWSDGDWFRFVDMIADFGFNVFEFWLVPRLFCREGLDSPYGRCFAAQMGAIIDYAARRGVSVEMLCSLTTVGSDWHTCCPHVPEEWAECRYLWQAWTERLPGLGAVGIFPGDPGGCSRHGCTPRTYIDGSLEIAEIIQTHAPDAEIELGTWGPPFFGWGNIVGPPNWQGEFIPEYQHTAWRFEAARTEDAMSYLLRRLPEFPAKTLVAVNLGFNPDGDPDGGDGAHDARPWAREIAKVRPVTTWDFSLTEGENAIFPHYRFGRLFSQRQRERQAAPYDGGICFTMTPMLNVLSLYQSAQSFKQPDADHQALTRSFYRELFGPDAAALADLLPLMEVIPDWGNYERVQMSRADFHRRMSAGAALLRDVAAGVNSGAALHPHPEQYRRELLWYFEMFAALSGASPDYDAWRRRYYERVYGIYAALPGHVDPRPERATRRLIGFFDPGFEDDGMPVAGRWVD